MEASPDGTSEDKGDEEAAMTGLLEVVVMVRGWFVAGRREAISSSASLTVVLALVGSDRVRGNPRPAKEVRRMLIFC